MCLLLSPTVWCTTNVVNYSEWLQLSTVITKMTKRKIPQQFPLWGNLQLLLFCKYPWDQWDKSQSIKSQFNSNASSSQYKATKHTNQGYFSWWLVFGGNLYFPYFVFSLAIDNKAAKHGNHIQILDVFSPPLKAVRSKNVGAGKIVSTGPNGSTSMPTQSHSVLYILYKFY